MKHTLKKIFLLLSVPAVLCTAPQVFSYEMTGSGVDWNRNMVTAEGTAFIQIDSQGHPVNIYTGGRSSLNEARRNAYAGARETASEKLIAILKKIQVTQDDTIESLMENRADVRNGLSDAIMNARTDEYPGSFDSSVCRIMLPLGDLIQALPVIFPCRDFPSRTDIHTSTKYTGLIVDARGFKMKQMLLPVIYNKNGLEIFNSSHVNGPDAVKYGMVKYVYSEKEASACRRTGLHPLYVNAVDDNRGCPVLSEKDVRKLFSDPATLSALRECRIVFIISRENL